MKIAKLAGAIFFLGLAMAMAVVVFPLDRFVRLCLRTAVLIKPGFLELDQFLHKVENLHK